MIDITKRNVLSVIFFKNAFLGNMSYTIKCLYCGDTIFLETRYRKSISCSCNKISMTVENNNNGKIRTIHGQNKIDYKIVG